MKKIMHFTMSNSFGGAEKVIFSIIKNRKDKYKFSYISPKGSIDKYIKKLNINHYSTNEINKIKEANIIHAHDFKAAVKSSFIKKKGQRLIAHLHTSHKWINGLNLKTLIFLIAQIRIDEVIFVSNSMAKESYIYKKIKNKSKIIVNPVETKTIEALAKGDSNHYDIAFLGRLSSYKDPLRFIRIVKDLENIKSVMIGDGELKQECINEINRLNIKEKIDLVGFKENPYKIINNSKLLVITSKIEALGLAALEAMTLGKPVISTKAGGLKDIILKKNGIMCDDDKEFIVGISKLLNDDKKYRKFSENSKEFVKKNFDIVNYMKEIDKLYR